MSSLSNAVISIVALAVLLGPQRVFAQSDTLPLPGDSFGLYTVQAILTPENGVFPTFATRVAVAGNVLLAAGGGAVYVFERGPHDNWVETARIVPEDAATNFGRALAFDGSTAIVAADGVAYLFRRAPAGAWQQIARLTASDGDPNFGRAVDIAGDHVVVGGLHTATTRGAYVFRRHPGTPDTWAEVAALVPGSAPNVGAFGTSVAINSDTALVTETRAALTVVNVFSRHAGGTDQWGFVRTFGPIVFGGPVALSEDTGVFAGGEFFHTAIVLARQAGPGGEWRNEASFTDPTFAGPQTFVDAGINGSSIILGSLALRPGAGPIGPFPGAYILARHQGGPNAWRPVTIVPGGSGVAISGDTAAMGISSRGVVVLVSDIDRDGLRDGIDPCPRDPLNNVAGGCTRDTLRSPIVDHAVSLDELTIVSAGNPFVIRARFTNQSGADLANPFFEVIDLSGANTLLNADGGPKGVGATLSLDVGDGVLSAGESFEATFVITLDALAPFTFRVTLRGDPAP